MWKTLETTELCGELYKVILSHILTFLMISYEIPNLKNKQTNKNPFFTQVGRYQTCSIYLDQVLRMTGPFFTWMCLTQQFRMLENQGPPKVSLRQWLFSWVSKADEDQKPNMCESERREVKLD
jgi:hypothetical protein